MKKFIKFLKYSFLFCFILGLLLAAGGAYWLYYQIVKVPAPEMTEANISAILGRESPVYYSDGVTQFGVLFEDVHRQYVILAVHSHLHLPRVEYRPEKATIQ